MVPLMLPLLASLKYAPVPVAAAPTSAAVTPTLPTNPARRIIVLLLTRKLPVDETKSAGFASGSPPRRWRPVRRVGPCLAQQPDRPAAEVNFAVAAIPWESDK